MKRVKEKRSFKMIFNGTLYVLYFYYLVFFINKSEITNKWIYIILGCFLGIVGLYYEFIKIKFQEATDFIVYKLQPQTGIDKLMWINKYDKLRDFSYYSDMYVLNALYDLEKYDEIKRLAKKTNKAETKNALNDATSQLGYMIVYGQENENKKSHEAYKKFKLLYDNNTKDFKKLEGLFMKHFEYYEALDCYYQKEFIRAKNILDSIDNKKISTRESKLIDKLKEKINI